MKKVFVLIAAAIFATVVMTACGNKEVSQESIPETIPETTQETINYPSPNIQENLPDKKPELSEDFYIHVNYDQLKNTVMPDGKASWSNFAMINEGIIKDMIEVLDKETGEGEQKIVFDYYRKYMDMDERNKAGWSSVIPYGEKIMSAKTFDDLMETVCSTPELAYQLLPVKFDVSPDGMDSLKEVTFILVPGLDLEDSAEYTKISSYGQRLKDADDHFFTKLLLKYGLDEDSAAQVINNRFALEGKLAQYIYPTETSYRDDWEKLIYNPFTEEELVSLAGTFPMEKVLKAYGIDNNIKYIVDQPEYYEALQNIMTEENLEEIKSWMLIEILKFAASYTDEEALTAKVDWNNEKNGSSGRPSLESMAYDTISDTFTELFGLIYADRFFSQEEKEEVTKMVYDLLDVYRRRLQNIDWLGDETRKTAVEKLDAMGVYVGYPEEVRFDYSGWEINPKADLFTYQAAIYAERGRQNANYAGKNVNRAAWGHMMAPNVVNACYEPTQNSIYFPAAILQAPFYDKDNSVSANMGGIGIVIGHEITHAFDTMGSQYDKNGNMNNWWTEEDLNAFQERTKVVGERYAAYVLVDDIHVNGDLTIGETVADLGGASSALQILQERKANGEEIDYSEFFETDANVWFEIATKERVITNLKNNPHAPSCLRANVNLAQFDEFYETYGIKEGDKMYTAPEDRLKVW